MADDVLQSRETALAYGATTTLKAIAEELKPVTGLPTIPAMGLLEMERQSIGDSHACTRISAAFAFRWLWQRMDKV